MLMVASKSAEQEFGWLPALEKLCSATLQPTHQPTPHTTMNHKLRLAVVADEGISPPAAEMHVRLLQWWLQIPESQTILNLTPPVLPDQTPIQPAFTAPDSLLLLRYDLGHPSADQQATAAELFPRQGLLRCKSPQWISHTRLPDIPNLLHLHAIISPVELQHDALLQTIRLAQAGETRLTIVPWTDTDRTTDTTQDLTEQIRLQLLQTDYRTLPHGLQITAPTCQLNRCLPDQPRDDEFRIVLIPAGLLTDCETTAHDLKMILGQPSVALLILPEPDSE